MLPPFLASERIVLHSPLSADRCATRLESAIHSSGAVVGVIDGPSIRLRKRIAYHNSFQTLLRATIWGEISGARIEGQLGMHPLVLLLFSLMLGFILLIGGLLVSGVLRSASFEQQWPQILGVATMPLPALAIVWFGRYLARDEARFLKDFLRQTLDARE